MRPGLAVALIALVGGTLAGCVGDGEAPAARTGFAGTPCPKEFIPSKPTTFSPARPRATFETSQGTLTIELHAQEAPETVENFLDLARDGFYDGTRFHRIEDGFMIQGGDPLTRDESKKDLWGKGGGPRVVPDEFHPGLRHDREGVLSMANTGPNTASSQFFLTLDAAPWLDDKHAVFGRVVAGLDVLRALGATETDPEGRPVEPVTLHSVTVAGSSGEEPPVHAVGALFASPRKVTEPGNPVTLVAVAQNRGNVRDNLSFTVHAPEGWACSLEERTLHVPAGTARAVLLRVTPPDESPRGQFTVRFRAASEADPATFAEAQAAVEVGRLGPAAREGGLVTANYVVLLEDGRVVDTTLRRVAEGPLPRTALFVEPDAYRTFAFPLDGKILKAFRALALGEKEGETTAGRFPPSQAYGEKGSHPLAGRAVVFEMEIVSVR